jgi:hypothetical protein
MRNLGLLALLALLLSSGELHADWWPVHALPGTRVTAELLTLYDDNPFKYSSGDLEEFDAGGRPYRFPIETSDDLAIRGGLGFELDLGNTAVDLEYRGYQYLKNSIKSYQVIHAGLRQDLGSTFDVQLRYVFLPDYMIRHYPVLDSGPRVYRPCTFIEHLGELGLQARLGRVTLAGFGSLGILNYGTDFDHYDSDLLGLGGSLTYRFSRDLYSRLEYEYRMSSADGADIPRKTDLSNDRHTGKLLLRKRRFLWPRLDVSVSLQYMLRIFTTDKPHAVDPYHSQREDSEYQGRLSLDYEINRRLTVLARYSLVVRTTTSPAKPEIDEVKDYTRNVVTAGLRFTL